MDICHIMTVNAFAKDKLGKSPNLNCFGSYLFHGRRRLFPFQLFVLVIQLSLSVRGKGSIARMLQTRCQWAGGGVSAQLPQHRTRRQLWCQARAEPSAPSHLGSSASVSSFFPFQGFWSFPISFFSISCTCTVASGSVLGVCILVSSFQSWYV